MTANTAITYPYYNIKKFNSIFLTSKYPILFSLYCEFKKFNSVNLRNERIKEKKRDYVY